MYLKHEDLKKNEYERNGTSESINLDRINHDVDMNESKTSPAKSIKVNY